MIVCKNCGKIKKGNSGDGQDIMTEGWKWYISEDYKNKSVILCKNCKEIVEKLASEIYSYIGVRNIHLCYLLNINFSESLDKEEQELMIEDKKKDFGE